MNLSKAVWRKASRSTVEGDNCIEVAGVPQAAAFRDSKDPNGPQLIISRRDFRRLAELLEDLRRT